MDKRLLILIVDDLKDNRLAIKIALKNEGYILEEASNGSEALSKCKELKPDVILMDVIMPVMDGYEATKEIRKIEEFNRVPILMITALSEKDDKIKALDIGVNDFISKPFNKHELIARCKSYANMSRINNQYILASKNRYTNLPNKSALQDNINSCKNPKLILFKIEDYEQLEEFYTEEIVNKIECEYVKMIFDLLSVDCKDTILHHTNEGEFALLKDDVENVISHDRVYQNCKELYDKTKASIIVIDNYEYNISIVISFSSNNKHLFEDARIGLNHAIKEDKKIVFADDIVEQVNKESSNNIKTIKMIKTALKQGTPKYRIKTK
jgi:CheY-like chemotaxis protein